nr:S-layer homology domain-containing protein [Microbacterium sp. BE35]
MRALRDLSQSPFVDIPRDHASFDEILELSDAGVLPVYPDASGRGEFRSDAPVTRGTLALALQMFTSGRGPVPTAQPTDSAQDSNELAAAKWLRVATYAGTTDDAAAITEASIAAPATRAETASVLYALAGRPQAPSTSLFTDVDDSDGDAAAIRWMSASGIARGWETSDGLPEYRPRVPLTREALVVMLTRFRSIIDASD